MSCCKNDLGEFPHNQEILTGIDAAQTGLHKLTFTGPNYTKFSKYLRFTAAEEIAIPVGLLNEDFQYTLVITQPDNTNIEVDECENFSLRTFINKIECDELQYN